MINNGTSLSEAEALEQRLIAVAGALLAKAQFVPSGQIENLDEHDPELVYFKDLITARQP